MKAQGLAAQRSQERQGVELQEAAERGCLDDLSFVRELFDEFSRPCGIAEPATEGRREECRRFRRCPDAGIP